MDPAERARLEHERVQKGNARLKTRIESLVHPLVRGTALFRSHPELGEPRVFVHIFQQFVQIDASLDPPQWRILPLDGRRPLLEGFVEELRVGFEKISADLHLPSSTDSRAVFGASGPVFVGELPSGYHAILVRRKPE